MKNCVCLCQGCTVSSHVSVRTKRTIPIWICIGFGYTKICHFLIMVSYLCIGQNQKNQPYLVQRSKRFVSVATLACAYYTAVLCPLPKVVVCGRGRLWAPSTVIVSAKRFRASRTKSMRGFISISCLEVALFPKYRNCEPRFLRNQAPYPSGAIPQKQELLTVIPQESCHL